MSFKKSRKNNTKASFMQKLTNACINRAWVNKMIQDIPISESKQLSWH